MAGGGSRDLPAVTLVVDVANVVGSRPDGWWRDRVGASQRLLDRLAGLAGGEVTPDQAAAPSRVDRLVAVVEGQARGVNDVPGLEVVRAPRDGDGAIVDVCQAALVDGEVVLLVTADRGLRARLAGVMCLGPGWLLQIVHDPGAEVP